MRILKCYGKKIVRKELKACYKFFINEVNDNTKSEGYGLIRDKTILADNISSIASYYENEFDFYGITHVITGKSSKLHMLLSRDTNYELIYKDDYFVIYRRLSAENLSTRGEIK